MIIVDQQIRKQLCPGSIVIDDQYFGSWHVQSSANMFSYLHTAQP